MAVLVKILAAGATLWLAAVLALFLLQDRMLFPRWAMGPGPSLPATASEIRIHRPGGAVLVGYRLDPTAPAEDAPLVLGFGGNAWDGAAMLDYLRQIFPHHPVAAFHHRGYGPSTGRPSATALLGDALAIHDHLAAPRVVAVGFSIGAGPAARLAAERPLAGVILVTPFDSLTAVARAHFPWAPVSLFFRHPMEPAADLARSAAPLALIAATRDEVIPPARTRALRDALADAEPGIVFDRTLTAGHNDIYHRADFVAAMREALAILGGR